MPRGVYPRNNHHRRRKYARISDEITRAVITNPALRLISLLHRWLDDMDFEITNKTVLSEISDKQCQNTLSLLSTRTRRDRIEEKYPLTDPDTTLTQIDKLFDKYDISDKREYSIYIHEQYFFAPKGTQG